jgi:threonine/homoserine/homoserine lactone efflux protein
MTGWNLMLVLSINFDMAFLSSIHALAAAFLMGLAAAAPMGPVNMMAVRRGVVGGWRHTLACAIGSVSGDLLLFSLALIGGRYLLSGLTNPKLQSILLSIGVVLLLPVGVYFLAIAFKEPRRAFNSARKRWRQGPIPARLVGEAAKSFALTILNPLTIVYWVAVTSSWLPFANSVLGSKAFEWGILMAGAGLTAWFAGLIAFVRFVPHRTGAVFFCLANAILGLIFIGFGAYCAVILLRHFPR